MFIGREEELSLLRQQFQDDKKSVVLVYGKRRIGKSTLIAKASEYFNGCVVNYMCTQTSVQGNLDLLTNSICTSLNLPLMHFSHFSDLFLFLSKQREKILIIFDEYQYLKEGGKKGEVDSIMQNVVDHLADHIKIVFCGSFVSVMKELLEKENPLFGRFTAVIHLKEMNYYDSSQFYLKENIQNKIARYAVLGGCPYVITCAGDHSLEDCIKKMILPETGILRIYIENIVLQEVRKAYDVRILQALGNGKKRYTEIENWTGMQSTGLLDKQLQQLLKMETIQKTAPINRQNDKKKQFYEIHDNLIRFYFTYIFGNQSALSHLGSDAFYDLYIKPSLNEFISRRFETMVCQYFERQVHHHILNNVYDIGSYWYDDARNHKNGEFDCVLQHKDHYEFIECKYYKDPMTLAECRKEEEQVKEIPGLEHAVTGFACSTGFSFHSDQYRLITGKDLYDAGL